MGGLVSVFGALVYIDVDKAAIKALLTLMYIPLKDTCHIRHGRDT